MQDTVLGARLEHRLTGSSPCSEESFRPGQGTAQPVLKNNLKYHNAATQWTCLKLPHEDQSINAKSPFHLIRIATPSLKSRSRARSRTRGQRLSEDRLARRDQRVRGGPSTAPSGDAAGRAGGWRGSARPPTWISTEECRPRFCRPSRRTGRVYAPFSPGLRGRLSARPRPSGSSPPTPPRRASLSRAAPTLSRVIAPPLFRAASPPRVSSGLCAPARARAFPCLPARPLSARSVARRRGSHTLRTRLAALAVAERRPAEAAPSVPGPETVGTATSAAPGRRRRR